MNEEVIQVIEGVIEDPELLANHVLRALLWIVFEEVLLSLRQIRISLTSYVEFPDSESQRSSPEAVRKKQSSF